MLKNYLYKTFCFLLFFISSHIHAQINVACIGNSITQGGYPIPLAELLGTNFEVIDYGEGSRTLLENTDLPYILSTQHSYSIAHHHDVVLILLGTNDTKEKYWPEHDNFKNDYLDLMDDYLGYPGHEDPVFVLGFPPPVFDNVYTVNNEPIVNYIIPVIRQIANETNATIADFYSALDGRPELYTDGVHPNSEGRAILAEVAYNAIHKALDPPPAIPTGLKTKSYLNRITLSWNANTESDIKYYKIYRADNPDISPFSYNRVQHPTITYVDNNVALNHIYYYSLKAVDIAGNVSARTSRVLGETFDSQPPDAPLNLQVLQEADTLKLIWTPNSETDVAMYYLYRSTKQSELQDATNIIAGLNTSISSYNDTEYISAKTYYFGVKAMDISGNQSTISNIVNITTKSRPISSDTTLTFYEDVTHHFLAADFPFYDADNDSIDKIIFINSGQCDYFTCNNDTIDDLFTFSDTSKLVFTPKLDEFGENYTDFTFRVVDSFGSASIDTYKVQIDVLPVNDAPHINPISDIYLIEDSHNIMLPISGINSGSVTEVQNISLQVLPSDTMLIKITEIHYNSPEDTGYVIIDPVENVFGTRPVTIRVIDDGGTENGGINYVDKNFTMFITPTNDPPGLNIIDKIFIDEDSESIIELGGINAGPQEFSELIYISIISNNTDILPNPILNYTSPDTSAFVTIATIPNLSGNSSITIFMSDDGGTELGGLDSMSYIIPVEIKPVNDKPSDFNIITPTNDSTYVMNKSNYLNTFSIYWEESSDIENENIFYDVIFNGDLSELSQYGLNSTNTDYSFKEILAATDTVSIANSAFSIVASDGELQTDAINSGVQIIVDGRLFAPAKLNLDQNHPNPFNHDTLIGFDLPKRTKVTLTIYNLLGEEIVKLIDNKIHERGYSTISWNGFDKYQNHIPSGAYIIQFKSDSEVKHKKLLLLK